MRRGRRSKLILGAITVVVLLFLFLPLFVVVGFSFNGGFDAFLWGGFSTSPYSQVPQDSTLLSALWTSLEVAAATGLLSVVIGLAGGLATTGREWYRRILLLLFIVILATPEIVGASGDLLWFVTLGVSNGFVRLVIAHSIFGSALTALVVRSRALGLEKEVFDAANDLGARTLDVLRTVTIPLLIPALLAGGLLSFTFSLEDLVTSVFVSTAQVTPLPVYILGSIHSQFHADIFAIAVFMFVATSLIFLVALAALGGGSRARLRRGLRLLGATPR
ncbi:MAG TPA: ABC transporter permease subunit [Acidimicrobiales bacterium]|nr:ABC transporter permease subunit [Acidimicrobiales bacterium]